MVVALHRSKRVYVGVIMPVFVGFTIDLGFAFAATASAAHFKFS